MERALQIIREVNNNVISGGCCKGWERKSNEACAACGGCLNLYPSDERRRKVSWGSSCDKNMYTASI